MADNDENNQEENEQEDDEQVRHSIYYVILDWAKRRWSTFLFDALILYVNLTSYLIATELSL